MPRGDGLVHGTIGGATNYHCRCDLCRGALAEYHRQWRKRNPEKAKEAQRRHNASPAGIARRKAYRLRNRDRGRAMERLRLYGLEPERWDALMAAQGGVCAICKRPNPDGRNLHVDHDHTSGKVRGLLCGGCNAALGLFGDTPARLQDALDYLHQSNQILC